MDTAFKSAAFKLEAFQIDPIGTRLYPRLLTVKELKSHIVVSQNSKVKTYTSQNRKVKTVTTGG